MFSVRTDLALEAREIINENQTTSGLEGIETTEDGDENVRITRVKITSEKGEKALGKRKGTYITIEAPSLAENDPDISEKSAFRRLRKTIRIYPKNRLWL